MAVRKRKTVEETPVVEDITVTPEDVVQIPEEVDVQIDETVAEEEIKSPEDKKVKIRMREDHHCSIAMVRYDLKKGEIYFVPSNVKLILEKAGLLSPI